MADYDARVLCSARRPPSVRPLLGPTPRVGALTATSRAPRLRPRSTGHRLGGATGTTRKTIFDTTKSTPPRPTPRPRAAAQPPFRAKLESRRVAPPRKGSAQVLPRGFASHANRGRPWPRLGPGPPSQAVPGCAAPRPYLPRIQPNFKRIMGLYSGAARCLPRCRKQKRGGEKKGGGGREGRRAEARGGCPPRPAPSP